ENVLSRAAILCDGEEIRADDLDLAGLAPAVGAGDGGGPQVDAEAGRPLKAVLEEQVRAIEKRAIVDALARAAGSPARAAQLLGISRASIYSKIKEYGIES
ncbi:MAG TPA: helix-turn-helix domain-containing protein, partial [Kofleriaceae bacterium]|nr:helix-turn-helix domain-containing protein [Kofleriaceae bacterium]